MGGEITSKSANGRRIDRRDTESDAGTHFTSHRGKVLSAVQRTAARGTNLSGPAVLLVPECMLLSSHVAQGGAYDDQKYRQRKVNATGFFFFEHPPPSRGSSSLYGGRPRPCSHTPFIHATKGLIRASQRKALIGRQRRFRRRGRRAALSPAL